MPTFDTFTPQQFEASIADALKGVAPADVKPPTLLERLVKFRSVLKKYRAKGYTAQQIATALRQSPLGLDVSPSLVRKATNGGRKKTPVKYEAIFPTEAPAAPKV